MLKSIKGVCRNGQIEPLESMPEGTEGEVIITFLGAQSIDLVNHGIDERQAADLRRRLQPFAEDWNRPEMDVYDAI